MLTSYSLLIYKWHPVRKHNKRGTHFKSREKDKLPGNKPNRKCATSLSLSIYETTITTFKTALQESSQESSQKWTETNAFVWEDLIAIKMLTFPKLIYKFTTILNFKKINYLFWSEASYTGKPLKREGSPTICVSMS